MAVSKTVTAPPGAVSRRPWWKQIFYLRGRIDMPFLIILMIVLSAGLVCLFSASYSTSFYESGDSYAYITSQLRNAVIGVFLMFVASLVDYRFWKKLKIPFIVLGIAVALLVVVYFYNTDGNVRRWIPLGPFNLQPSEVAKFAIILFFAYWVDKQQERMGKFTWGFLFPLIALGIVAALVVGEPHLSGTILICGIGFLMLFIGGTRWYWLLGLLAVAVVGVYFLVFVKGYEYDRIEVFLDPFGVYNSGQAGRDSAWQTIQSLYAIGSGGLLGEGLGNSRQKHLFLPEPQNDFIFAIICEEFGFVGAVLVIALFGVLIWRGFYIALKAPDRFSCMLGIGLTLQIGLQVLMNIAVVTNSMPNTGISLPFFSYGGSSLIMLLAQMGILLSISRHIKDKG